VHAPSLIKATGSDASAFAKMKLVLRLWLLPALILGILLGSLAGTVRADDSTGPKKTLADALPPARWRQVENSVDRGLAWIAARQSPDGSFPTFPSGQPAVTSLCVMAFLSRGHQPGSGPYGELLNRAIDFVLSSQKENGLLCYEVPQPYWERKLASHTASYNHAIAGLMLGEAYGHVSGPRAKKVKAAIGKAILFTRRLQTRSKPYAEDVGGWRYIVQKPGEPDADLSVTAWQLMFLRSAKNAEFDVPEKYMDEGIAFVRRCWDPQTGMFNYSVGGTGGTEASRGTTGAGILSLSMAGQHNTPMARAAGDWLVAHPYGAFGESYGPWDKFYYSTYYCSQAAAQLGGRYWEKFYPPMVDVFLKVQSSDGSFPPEPLQGDAIFGSTYSTAIAVLALTPAYQLLPVYQR
jgi:hypothetical protein